MKTIRATYRLVRTALHVLSGALIVALLFPVCGEVRQDALKRWWSIGLLCALGIKAQWRGTIPTSGLLVANHISFIDIFLINAVMPASFVSKADVSAWPVIGWLARHNDTIFLERGSRSAAQRTREALVGHLLAGKRVALFPEGTTTIGDRVLPFHSALLQSAIDAESMVVSVAIRYVDADGRCCIAPAYVDDLNLVQCLWAIANQNETFAFLDVLSPLSAAGSDRRHLSAHAHHAISHHLGAHSGAFAKLARGEYPA